MMYNMKKTILAVGITMATMTNGTATGASAAVKRGHSGSSFLQKKMNGNSTKPAQQLKVYLIRDGTLKKESETVTVVEDPNPSTTSELLYVQVPGQEPEYIGLHQIAPEDDAVAAPSSASSTPSPRTTRPVLSPGSAVANLDSMFAGVQSPPATPKGKATATGITITPGGPVKRDARDGHGDDQLSPGSTRRTLISRAASPGTPRNATTFSTGRLSATTPPPLVPVTRGFIGEERHRVSRMSDVELAEHELREGLSEGSFSGPGNNYNATASANVTATVSSGSNGDGHYNATGPFGFGFPEEFDDHNTTMGNGDTSPFGFAPLGYPIEGNFTYPFDATNPDYAFPPPFGAPGFNFQDAAAAAPPAMLLAGRRTITGGFSNISSIRHLQGESPPDVTMAAVEALLEELREENGDLASTDAGDGSVKSFSDFEDSD